MAVITQQHENVRMPDEVWEKTADYFETILVPAIQQIDGDVEQTTLNGTPVLALGGESFVAATRLGMAFRLSGKARYKAWALDGSKLWDPTLKPDHAPRQEWVIVRYIFRHNWLDFARQALTHVQKQTV